MYVAYVMYMKQLQSVRPDWVFCRAPLSHFSTLYLEQLSDLTLPMHARCRAEGPSSIRLPRKRWRWQILSRKMTPQLLLHQPGQPLRLCLQSLKYQTSSSNNNNNHNHNNHNNHSHNNDNHNHKNSSKRSGQHRTAREQVVVVEGEEGKLLLLLPPRGVHRAEGREYGSILIVSLHNGMNGGCRVTLL